MIRARISALTTITEGGANATDKLNAKDWAIRVTGTETPASVYAADVAAGWGHTTRLGEDIYRIESNLRIGDGSTATTFTVSAGVVLQVGAYLKTNTGTQYHYKKRTILAQHTGDTFAIGEPGSGNFYYGGVLLISCYSGYDPYNIFKCKCKWYQSFIKWHGYPISYDNCSIGGQASAGDLDIQNCVLEPTGGFMYFPATIPAGTNPFYNNCYAGSSTQNMYVYDKDLTIKNLHFGRSNGVLVGTDADFEGVDFGSARYFAMGNSAYTGSAVNCTMTTPSTQISVSAGSTNTANLKYDVEISVYDSAGNAVTGFNARLVDSQGTVVHNATYSAAIRVTTYTVYGGSPVTKTDKNPVQIWISKPGYLTYYERITITNDNRKRAITILHSPTLGRGSMGAEVR
jgi:hypothetical protein